jgi:hypothetical protein
VDEHAFTGPIPLVTANKTGIFLTFAWKSLNSAQNLQISVLGRELQGIVWKARELCINTGLTAVPRTIQKINREFLLLGASPM